jgi:osmoprotectant transport system substrate-binding protein
MRLHRKGAVGASLLVVALMAAACSSSGGGSGAGKSITIGTANFSENVMLGHLYEGVLKKAGYNVSVKENIGSREVLVPALEKGDLDLTPEYAGNLLNFVDPSTNGLPLNETVSKLKSALSPKNLTVLNPSKATDGDVLVANAQTASKYNLKKISDLKAIGNQLVLGGPPECATRETCLKGLEDVYGIHFKSFRPLDAGGPLTANALANNDVQIGRMFSADSTIKAKGFVVLQDDKSFQLAGNVIPLIRLDKVDGVLTSALNKLSQTLTTDDLIRLDDEVQTQKQDPTAVAQAYLKSKGLA